MISKLPPHTPDKTLQLATWAREFRDKPKAVLLSIATNPTWQVKNLNERAVAIEALIYRKLMEKSDISPLLDLLMDDENFPIIINKNEIRESDFPEGVSKEKIRDPFEFTRCEFQRTNARLRARAGEMIAEHILATDNSELLPDFNRTIIDIIDNMIGEPYFLPQNDLERPDIHLIDFIRTLYLTGTESASRIMHTIGINERDLSLSPEQKLLLQSYSVANYSI